ncbi:TetR/AcrR family transcriptional regulator [Pseudonocardia nigra]|uniref:TetR/AcrR family transcriptional regulator n=1 Tax=Pseudonocardia nigra TaxID=1921578 RepID=UPI001C607B51|nr:TetR family transcriptional regulator [Pseudonocardia nigra]
MPRPRTQEKRRLDLVEAALQAGADRGLRSLSLADVARRAGLTRGAVLYYFDDLDDLLVEAHRAGIQRIGDQRDELVSAEAEPSRKLAVAITSGLPTGPDDALMRILYEFDVLAGSSELHDVLVQRMYQRQAATYRDILAAGAEDGSFRLVGDIEETTMNFVALEDAYGLHIVAGNRLITVERARAAMFAFARQAGCPAA